MKLCREKIRGLGWVAYLLGGIAFKLGSADMGALIIFGGMLAHWRMWLMGVVAFIIGANWR